MLSAGLARRSAPEFWPWRGAGLAVLLHVAMLISALAWLKATDLPKAREPPAVTLIVASPAPALAVVAAVVKSPAAAAPLSLPLPPPLAPAIALTARPEPRARPVATLAAPTTSAPLAFAPPASPTAPTGPTQPARPAIAGNTPPAYPSLSRTLGEQGRVLLGIHITGAGAADAVVITKSSGFVRLDDAARAAVQNWRFEPALCNGKAVTSVLPLWISFRLR